MCKRSDRPFKASSPAVEGRRGGGRSH
jgi:hypothetical protein